MAQIKGSKADLFYGASGTYKTSNIGRAAEWALKKYGKPTRLVSADGGGWVPIQSLVDAGIVAAWNPRDRKRQIEDFDKACQGYWPEDPEDPESPLLAPFFVSYGGHCLSCGYDAQFNPGSTPKQRQFPCPKCKELVAVVSWRKPNPANDLTQYAIVAFEGLTSFCDAMRQHLERRQAVLSEEPSYKWKEEGGEEEYAGGNKSYYGFVQNRGYEFVMKTNSLPVEKVIWTALEGRGEDRLTKTPVYGPLLAGNAATARSAAWFGNMLHFEAIETKLAAADGVVAVKSSVRMYCRPHADGNTNIIFPAKTRAPYKYGSQIPDFMEPNVGMLFSKIDQLEAKALDEARELKPTEAVSGA